MATFSRAAASCLSGASQELLDNPDVQEFYLGIKAADSIKGYRRYKRRRRWA